MAIGPVELNGSITRTQDFQALQQNEAEKGLITHANQQILGDRKVEDNINQVHKKDDAAKNSDADGKNKNEYQGDGGRKRKKEDSDGRVIQKSTASFDIRI